MGRSSASTSAARSRICSGSTRRRARFRVAKVPSQRGDEAAGFLQGLLALGAIESFGAIVHGTTVGTNTLLERRGPRIGVITTRGFRDVLEMRRRDRRQTWGLWGEFVPIAARDLRLEVDERTLADGSIRTPVDEAAVMAAAKALRERGRAGARDHLHQRLRQCRERAPRARRRGESLAERAPVRLASGAAGNPRIRARLDDRAQRLSAAGRRRLYRQARRRAGAAEIRRHVPHRPVQRRRDVDGDGAPSAGAHRFVGSGGGRYRRGRDRARRADITTSSPAIWAVPRSTSR